MNIYSDYSISGRRSGSDVEMDSTGCVQQVDPIMISHWKTGVVMGDNIHTIQ